MINKSEWSEWWEKGCKSEREIVEEICWEKHGEKSGVVTGRCLRCGDERRREVKSRLVHRIVLLVLLPQLLCPDSSSNGKREYGVCMPLVFRAQSFLSFSVPPFFQCLSWIFFILASFLLRPSFFRMSLLLSDGLPFFRIFFLSFSVIPWSFWHPSSTQYTPDFFRLSATSQHALDLFFVLPSLSMPLIVSMSLIVSELSNAYWAQYFFGLLKIPFMPNNPFFRETGPRKYEKVTRK